jgi:predicted esterase
VRGLSKNVLISLSLSRAAFHVVLKTKAHDKSAHKVMEILHFFSTLHVTETHETLLHKRTILTKKEEPNEEEGMKEQTSSKSSSPSVCLCFHGFSQNGLVFRQRTGSIRTKKLKREYEFVFLDAPHCVDGVFDVDVNDEKNIEKRENEETAMGTMRSWWLAGENVSSGATKAKDGSWIRPAKSEKIVRLEESVALIENALKEHEGRVRALVGFSQGATLIGILKRVKPELFENVRRVVSVAGFDPLDARFYEKDGFDEKSVIDVPSMHVHGKNDALVTRDRSDRLRDKFYNQEKSVVFEHEGGHGVPSSREFREAFEKFLLIPDGEGKDE